MIAFSSNSSSRNRAGFTLLELIVAMVVLVIVMSIVFEAFSGTIRGWKRGNEVIDGIKHGDFAMQKLVSALDSTIYFYNPRKSYAFTFEKGSTAGLPSDTLSFVTSSSAFMKEGSPLQHSPHRIKIYIDIDDNGDPALFTQAVPALTDMEKFEAEYDTAPHLVSRAIQGLEIMFYSKDIDDWSVEWEKENSIPERIKIMLYVPSDDPNEEPIIFTRVLEIPVAKSVAAKLTGPSKLKASNRSNASQRPPSGGGSSGGGGAPSPPGISIPKR